MSRRSLRKSKKKESRKDDVDWDGNGEKGWQVGDYIPGHWESAEGKGKGSKMVQVTT